jgi:hypothetical protein
LSKQRNKNTKVSPEFTNSQALNPDLNEKAKSTGRNFKNNASESMFQKGEKI